MHAKCGQTTWIYLSDGTINGNIFVILEPTGKKKTNFLLHLLVCMFNLSLKIYVSFSVRNSIGQGADVEKRHFFMWNCLKTIAIPMPKAVHKQHVF